MRKLRSRSKMVVGGLPVGPRKSVWYTLRQRRGLQLLTIVGLLLLVGLAVWLVWPHTASKDSKTAVPQLTARDLSSQVSELVQKNKLNEAEKLISGQDAALLSKDTYLLLAQVQTAGTQYERARQTLQKVEKQYGMDYLLAMQLGEVELEARNYQQTISYYKQAIKLLEADKKAVLNADQLIKNLQTSIAALEKAPKR